MLVSTIAETVIRLTAHPHTLIPAKLLLEAPFASAENIVQDASSPTLYGSYFTELKNQ